MIQNKNNKIKHIYTYTLHEVSTKSKKINENSRNKKKLKQGEILSIILKIVRIKYWSSFHKFYNSKVTIRIIIYIGLTIFCKCPFLKLIKLSFIIGIYYTQYITNH